MAVFTGIDEAGLGPVLGPLCYGLVSFVIPEEEISSWRKNLKSLIQVQNLSLDDSKKIFQGSNKVRNLEKAVSDVLGLMSYGKETMEIQNLFLNTALNLKGNWSNYPLYKNVLTTNLPLRSNLDLSEIPSWKVKIAVTSCFEGEMNEVFEKGLNKSSLSLLKIGALIESVISVHPRENITFSIDKQGGRQFYSNFLGDIFPFEGIEMIRETPDASEYLVERKDQNLLFGFYKNGDALFEEISMASILAKWLRETYMNSFNSYWLTYNSKIQPTAGYPEDGKRFIKEMRPYFDKSLLSPDLIIRNR